MSCAERSTSDGARREPQIIDNLHRGASSISGAPSETNEERERADTLFEHLRNDVNVEGTSHGVQIRAEKRVGHPVQCLVQYAKDAEIDVLSLGHSGHSRLWGTFLGTTDKVVRHAPCSVFVVR